MIDHQAALIYTMVLVSACDGNMSDAEMRVIGENVRVLPSFAGYDHNKLTETLSECAALLGGDNGLDEAFKLVKAALPARLRETAYALACDVVAADGEASQEELRVLEMIRHRLNVDRLIAAGIERGARARFMTAE
jgi:tellurite resistance protein